MNFDFDYALQILPTLLRATVITFQATVGGMVLAMIVGLALELLRRSGVKPVVYATKGFVSFVRGTPLLIQLYFLYYVLPLYGLSLETMETGILGLGLHYGAYLSEVYRAGIDGVPKGQWEAATALNASRTHTWLRIILPQAVPPMLPAPESVPLATLRCASALPNWPVTARPAPEAVNVPPKPPLPPLSVRLPCAWLTLPLPESAPA